MLGQGQLLGVVNLCQVPFCPISLCLSLNSQGSQRASRPHSHRRLKAPAKRGHGQFLSSSSQFINKVGYSEQEGFAPGGPARLTAIEGQVQAVSPLHTLLRNFKSLCLLLSGLGRAIRQRMYSESSSVNTSICKAHAFHVCPAGLGVTWGT